MASPEERYLATSAPMQVARLYIHRAKLTQAAPRQLLLRRLKRLLLVLYLLHPCNRAHPCARGVPFILNITLNMHDMVPTDNQTVSG